MTEPEITETTMEVSRVIEAPRQAVYEALTDPSSRYAKAFVPNQAPGTPMDLVFERKEPAREGGTYRATMTADEGPAKGQHTAYGEFLELVPHERIVETHHWEGDPDHGETRVTITLEDVPGGTKVTILHEGLPSRESAKGHAEGFGESLANLAAAMDG